MDILLRKLTFDGVGPFREEEVFDLTTEGVTYVYAPNGHGKTSSIDLVRWLIRGKAAVDADEFRSLKQKQEKNVINHHRFRNMEGGRVEAILEVGDDGLYRVERSIEWGTSPSSDLVVERDEDGDWAPIDDPEGFLAELLPHERLGFNLLTGEHVRDFVAELSGPVVKESVERQLQNPEIVSLDESLEAIVDDLDKQAEAEERADRRRRKLRDKRADLKEREENFRETKREKEIEEHQLQDDVEELKQEQAKLDQAEERAAEREELREEVRNLEERRERELASIRAELTPSWPTLLEAGCEEAVEALLAEHEEAVDAHEAWEEDVTKAQLLEDRLEADTCWCGTEMDADHREEIRAHIDALTAGEPEVPELPVPDWRLQEWASGDGTDELAETIETQRQRLAEVTEDLRAKRERLEELDAELETDVEEKRDLIQRRIKAKKMKVNSIQDEKSKVVRKHLDAQERLNEIKSKLADMDDVSVDSTLLSRARKYRDAIRGTIDAALPKLRQDLLDRTQGIFDHLFQKDADYRITLSGSSMVPRVVRDVGDEEEIVPLSEGEKTRLGLALLFALREVAAEHPFLLLDAPFSTLDDEGVHRLLELIGDYEGQVVVFTKDAFPDGKWYDAVEAADPDVYRMDWMQEKGGDREGYTRIRPGKVEALRLQGGSA
jgi:DNA sulfur modification protein DndD